MSPVDGMRWDAEWCRDTCWCEMLCCKTSNEELEVMISFQLFFFSSRNAEDTYFARNL